MPLSFYPAEERGETATNWLASHHVFSFSDFFDPSRMAFGALRVLNDDVVEPGSGFPMHPHENFEIVTIVLAGALEHQDSMGNKGVIKAGEIQRMSAGTGIVHSETNPFKEQVHLLQIWVTPRKKGAKPSYDQRSAFTAFPTGVVKLISSKASKDDKNAMQIGADAAFAYGRLKANEKAGYSLENPAHGVFAYVISGKLSIEGMSVSQGDGIGITGIASFEISASSACQFALIEVPM